MRGLETKRNLDIMAEQRNSVDAEVAGLRISGPVSRRH